MITNRIDNITNNLQKMVERPIEALHFSPCYKIVKTVIEDLHKLLVRGTQLTAEL